MLLSFDRFLKQPVMSLQTGAELARTKDVLVDPRNLTVVAYELDGTMLDEHPSFLRVGDVREISNLGIIVDSSEEFVGLDDVIKLKEVYDFGFNLLGLAVVDDKEHKLGKITGYNLDGDSFTVAQLVVRRPLLKSLNETDLLIHRAQIVEVNNERIVVKSASDKSVVKESIREYANPFRASQRAQPEAIEQR